MNMSNITFQVLRLSTFVLSKCSEIMRNTIHWQVHVYIEWMLARSGDGGGMNKRCRYIF